MPNSLPKPLSPYFAQAPLAKRKNVTKACDHCRLQRIQCAKVDCTHTHNGLKRGREIQFINQDPATSWMTLKSSDISSADTADQYHENSTYEHFAAMNPFSGEVTDHLVEFPVDFLRQYIRGIVNLNLLYAMCACVARLSDRPAIAKTLLSSSGQICVDRFKVRMVHLTSQSTVGMLHTLIILAHAEYNAGHAQKAVQIEATAIGMVPELDLHLLRPPEDGKPFQSEAKRITFDWVERVSASGEQPMESLDDYSFRILHRIHKPHHPRDVDFDIHMRQLVVPGRLVRKFYQSVSSLDNIKPGHSSKVEQRAEGIDSTIAANMTTSRRQNIQEVYWQAEDALEHWRVNIPQDQQPCKVKDMVLRLESYGFVVAAYYFAPVIQLHWPYLLQACMPISSCKKKLAERAGDLVGQDVEEEELKSRVDQSELQMRESCLRKCVTAADKITATIEQFKDEDIKYRGYSFAFPVFIAGTVYGIQVEDKDKLAICRGFLPTFGSYYASVLGEIFLLDRLSSTNVAGSEVRERGGNNSSSSSIAMETLSDMVLLTPSMDTNQIIDFDKKEEYAASG
ncbi:hypothetical protein BGZ47_006173 [Haplosporangium gracile]|nr:hypothetical protein BGZ47_006173 [Haplosporangium gracile]